MARILIVEDEPEIATALEYDLKLEGYEVEVVRDGESASLRGREPGWDLILLDIMLPKMDGFDVCRELRHAGVKTPVILVTARAHEAEKVLGLDAGADDYVTKPFSLRELRARIRAVLRRTSEETPAAYSFGDCEVDFSRAELRRGGHPVEVTAHELRLLAAFIRGRGRVLNREQLIDAAWDLGTAITDRAVDTHVFNLRQKIEPVPSEPRYLIGIRGLGYRFDG